ncbi:hypothetical protein CRM22_009126 [Opisthorchis felineus]|uniref:Dienelactone hydrolase domain-containing protein n=1 Tax=Opisthorchis felineus TaxID=147828 RepID=A0A4S2LFZ4_OPIFE|nr:hypothetical protein CRM22_009126 [Opisthorchis felineus]
MRGTYTPLVWYVLCQFVATCDDRIGMSSMKESGIKVCCSSGTPSATGGCGDYSPVGKLVQLTASGPAAYYTRPKEGPLCNSSALIVVYDIFGIDILQTRRFADLLAERTHRRVVMPDFFRGRPWLLKNFPPKDGGEFVKWVETAGSWDVVSADLKSAHEFLLADGLNSSAPLGIIGFCWGGKQAVRACSGDSHARELGFKFLAGVSLHGAFLGPEDAEDLTVPMLFMPAGDDPDVGPIKVILDKKPFGAQCAYHRFDSETHGFAAARGDWNVPHTREAIMKALDLTANFFNKQLP